MENLKSPKLLVKHRTGNIDWVTNEIKYPFQGLKALFLETDCVFLETDCVQSPAETNVNWCTSCIHVHVQLLQWLENAGKQQSWQFTL